jgi:hypothetical protein
MEPTLKGRRTLPVADKRKDKDKDNNVIPHKIQERHEWKCKHCSAKGKAASKRDAKDALKLHMYFNH